MHNIAIIGAGTMGREHMLSCLSIPEVKVVGVFDGSGTRGEQFAEEFRIRHYSSYDAVLNDDHAEVLLICTPTVTHRELVVQGLQAGKHVFCEKPIARTLEDAAEIESAAREAKSRFMVGHVVRFFPEYLLLRDAIRSGRLGKVGVARFSRSSSFPHGSSEWYSDVGKSGGVILDMMIHDIDYVQWLFGSVRRLYARALTYDGLDQKDYALVVLRCAGNVIVHLEGSWMYREKTFFTKFEVAGSEGFVEFDSRNSATATFVGNKESVAGKTVMVPKSNLHRNPYRMELEHFLESITTGRKPLVGATEAISALRTTLAALESARTASPITM